MLAVHFDGLALVLRFGNAVIDVLHLLDELALRHKEQHRQRRENHQHRDRKEEIEIVCASVCAVHNEHFHHDERKRTADSTHEVDDRVALAAQRLGGNVRHQRHGGRAVRTHEDEQDAQRRAKEEQAEVVFRILQNRHRKHRADRSEQNERNASAEFCACARQRSHKRENDKSRRADTGKDFADQLNGSERTGNPGQGCNEPGGSCRGTGQPTDCAGDDTCAEHGEPNPLRRAVAVADRTEQRQQEERHDVIQPHDDTGGAVRQRVGVPQDQRDDRVVHLPERADGKKREPDEERSFVVQFHMHFSDF
ncbi:hypothetical protein SDC9_122006 [bioreactor metagenome]|uniref:Uncharacterized protein n=1 Tax=bioreactor metagenome TaxID=1076179 RepID=A0A645CDN4_9ZZZZ